MLNGKNVGTVLKAVEDGKVTAADLWEPLCEWRDSFLRAKAEELQTLNTEKVQAVERVAELEALVETPAGE